MLCFVSGDPAQLRRVAKLMEWKHALQEDHTRMSFKFFGMDVLKVQCWDLKGLWYNLEESIENNTPLGGDNDKVDGIVEETTHPSKLVSVEQSPEEKVTDD